MHIGSPELEDRVLHVDGGTMTPYWSNFAEAHDDSGSRVAVCSG